jgi:hypothetical protein
MTSRLGRIALLAANRSATTRHNVALLPSRSPLIKVTACQMRKINSTTIVREQYLHGYKDSERFHGKERPM